MSFKWFWRVATPIGSALWILNLVNDARRSDLGWMIIDSGCLALSVFLCWLAWTKPEKMTDVE